MVWGTFITLLLKALPDLLFLWRRHVEQGDREAIHDDIQDFRAALCAPDAAGAGGGLDRAAELLERRLREARDLRGGHAQAGAAD